MTKQLYQLEKTFKTHASAFIRYTFQPLFSLVMVMGALCMNTITAMLLYRYQSLSALVIFFGSNGFFMLALIVSAWNYARYKNR